METIGLEMGVVYSVLFSVYAYIKHGRFPGLPGVLIIITSCISIVLGFQYCVVAITIGDSNLCIAIVNAVNNRCILETPKTIVFIGALAAVWVSVMAIFDTCKSVISKPN
jgi:hypothetical protein